jgi:Cu/Ag efflux protein CusF
MNPLLTSIATLTVSAALSLPAFAQETHEPAAHGAAAMSAEHGALADGEVKKIDKTSGKVTLAHGPLPGGMPAMTMNFRVKDAAWLDQLKEGQKIRFATETVKGAMTINYFEPVK